MFKNMITALTVNYNTPALLESLLISFRQFYDIPYLIVDGSDTEHFEMIKSFAEKYNVEIHNVGYNIHHGPGMAYGIQTIQTRQILLLDTDIRVLRGGFVEDLQSKLRPESYGIGDISTINRDGVNVTSRGIKYLHPSCALLNKSVVMRYPLPIKHGAPMIAPMETIRWRNDILQHEQWITDDLLHSFYNKDNPINRHYIVHEWSGTVSRTGGIHLC